MERLQGFLKKKGGESHKFQERWFQCDFDNNTLHYYAKKPDIFPDAKTVKGLIPLSHDTRVEVDHSKSKEHRFKIITPRRTFFLVAKNASQRQQWVDWLTAYMDGIFRPTAAQALSPAPHPPCFKAQSRTQLAPDLFTQPSARDEGPSPQDLQRRRVSQEILSTEQTYLEALALLCKAFLEPMRNSRAELGLSLEDIGMLFSNAELLLEFHSELLGKLHDADVRNAETFPRESMSIGDIFVEAQPLFRAYEVYIGAHATSQETLERLLKRNPEIPAFLQELRELAGKNLDLQNLLSWPIQRIPRYVLLLKELLKTIPTSQDSWKPIMSALDTIERVADSINRAKTQTEHLEATGEISKRVARCGHLNLVQPHRQFFKEGILLMEQDTTTSSSASSSSSSQPNGSPATFFLFNDLIMWAKDDVYQGFWSLDNSTVIPNDPSGPHPCTFTFATKIYKASTQAHLPDQIDPSKTWKLTAGSATEATLWAKAIEAACLFLDQIPQHIRESQKQTWRNDSLQEEVRVQGFANLKSLKWKRFYCKLQGSTLFWYDGPADNIPKSSQSCSGCLVKDFKEDPKRQFCVALAKPGEKKPTFVLQTDGILYPVWIAQLKYASEL